MGKKIFYIILILLSVLATIKICFFNLVMDEEYAITLSYRIVAGDRMFLEMWEPHQTSGFLSAFFIKIYILLTGGIEFLVIYLRLMGALIQAGISFFLYRTLKVHFSPMAAFVAAIFFYNTLPKWIQVPEFANMLVWFSVLAFLCLMRAVQAEKHHYLWLILAGLSLSALVLSYPSCLFAVPLFIIGLYQAEHQTENQAEHQTENQAENHAEHQAEHQTVNHAENQTGHQAENQAENQTGHHVGRKRIMKDAGILIAVCVICGLLYVGYFLAHMSFGQFLFGIRQMTLDGAHSYTIWERLGAYGKELMDLSGHLLLVAAITLILYLALKKPGRGLGFLMLLLCAAHIHQGIIWLTDSEFFHYPLIHYYVLFGAGIFLILRNKKTQVIPQGKAKILFWLGIVPGAFVWLSALAITNTSVSVTGSYLMIGLLSSILLLGEATGFEMREKVGNPMHRLAFFAFLCILGATLFAKGFMVCESGGYKANITFVRQKALSGPAKWVYYRYIEGYGYNNCVELMEEYVRDGEAVLYVGQHYLRILTGNQVISNYSTISTPTYDERLLEYRKLYPERYPDVVIVDSGDLYLEDVRKLLTLGEAVAVREGIEIYRPQREAAE